MKSPNSTIDARKAATVMVRDWASPRKFMAPSRGREKRAAVDDAPPAGRPLLADDAFDQVVHAFQLDGRLAEFLAGGDDLLAGVVLERAFEDDELAGHELGPHVLGRLLGLVLDDGTVGRRLDNAFLEAASDQI